MKSPRGFDHSRRRILCALPALVLAVAATPSTIAAESALARLNDLRATLEDVRREGLPLLLFFSTPGCPYCAQMRQGYLAPRGRMGAKAGAMVREVDITSARRLIDRDGGDVTEAALAARLNVRTTPAVILVDDKLQALGSPLVGIGAAGFYEAYLQGAIESARQRLAERG